MGERQRCFWGVKKRLTSFLVLSLFFLVTGIYFVKQFLSTTQDMSMSDNDRIVEAQLLLREGAIDEEKKEEKIAQILWSCDDIETQGKIVRMVGSSFPHIVENMGKKIITSLHKYDPSVESEEFFILLYDPTCSEGSPKELSLKKLLKNIFKNENVAQNPMVSCLIYELVKINKSYMRSFVEECMISNRVK